MEDFVAPEHSRYMTPAFKVCALEYHIDEDIENFGFF